MIRVLGAQLSALDSSRTLSSVQLQLEQIIDKAHREAIECHQQILQDTQQCLVSVHQLAHQLQLPTPSSSCGEYITHTLSSLQDTRHSLQITKQQRIDTIQPIKQEIRQLVLALHQPASIDTSILDLQHDLSINYIQTLHNQLNIAKDLHVIQHILFRTNITHSLTLGVQN
jgi:antitoxin component HigA of HigAB toxin-antitoxin module